MNDHAGGIIYSTAGHRYVIGAMSSARRMQET